MMVFNDLPQIDQRRFVPEWNLKTDTICPVNDGFNGRLNDATAW